MLFRTKLVLSIKAQNYLIPGGNIFDINLEKEMTLDYTDIAFVTRFEPGQEHCTLGWYSIPDQEGRFPFMCQKLYSVLYHAAGLPGGGPRKSNMITEKASEEERVYQAKVNLLRTLKTKGYSSRGLPELEADRSFNQIRYGEAPIASANVATCSLEFLREAMVNAHGFFKGSTKQGYLIHAAHVLDLQSQIYLHPLFVDKWAEKVQKTKYNWYWIPEMPRECLALPD